MILAVLANDTQKDEITACPFFQKHEVLFSENISLWSNHIADVFIDFCFEPVPERIKILARLLPKPVLVNAVADTVDRLHPDFIRINGWPGFLKGHLLEAAAAENVREMAVALFGEDLVFVKDVPGLVSPRIVSMIINEAFFTWEAGTSTREEIDLAMKAGVGYPYGPFEWTEKIGLEKIAELLLRLKEENPLYEMAEGLKLKAVNP